MAKRKEVKDFIVCVRLPETLGSLLKERVRSSGLSRSDYIRLIIAREVVNSIDKH